MNKSPDHNQFRHIETWVFDLDNTLYPHECDLFSQVDLRMTEYIAHLLDLPAPQARKLQKDFYHHYGTTLKGLVEEYHIDPDDFLAYVHDIDYSWLNRNKALGAAIKALRGRKFIFTNGDRPHAERTLEQLGIGDAFDDIYDIKAADFVPKPAPDTYARFLKNFHIDATRAAMFEDLAHNLAVPKTLGMQTILIVPQNPDLKFLHRSADDKNYENHVDFITDNITDFLKFL